MGGRGWRLRRGEAKSLGAQTGGGSPGAAVCETCAPGSDGTWGQAGPGAAEGGLPARASSCSCSRRLRSAVNPVSLPGQVLNIRGQAVSPRESAGVREAPVPAQGWRLPAVRRWLRRCRPRAGQAVRLKHEWARDRDFQ